MSGRILLTGAAGFIASRVANLLVEQGYEVIGLDNLCDAYDVRLKEHRLTLLTGRKNFLFERLDISDRAALSAAWERTGPFDAVVNLAARAGVRPSVDNPWVYVDTNVTGTLNLLELCRRDGVGKFVLASTSSLYGARNPGPWCESQETDYPLSPYAASKKAAETLCYTYHYLHGIDVTVLRYFTVYGPAGRPDMSLFRFTRWIFEGNPVEIFGDGRQSRDFSYVEDIARGTVLGLQPLGYEIINLGSDRPAELSRVIELVEAEAGRQAELKFSPAHPADVPTTWANIEKARELLGWEPRTMLEEGVSNLAAWYRENRDWARELLL